MKTIITTSEKMNATLVIAQAASATVYTILGIVKVMLPIEVSNSLLPLIRYSPIILIRITGLFEVLGAIGLLAPSLLGSRTIVCFWAAIGLATISLSAIPLYIWLHEWNAVAVNFILSVVSVFIAWGNFNDGNQKNLPATSISKQGR